MGEFFAFIFIEINFPGASTQTPQGRLPPASQERGISPNLATLGISLHDAEHRGMYPPMIQTLPQSKNRVLCHYVLIDFITPNLKTLFIRPLEILEITLHNLFTGSSIIQ